MSGRVVNNRSADRLKHRIFRLEDYTHKITTPCLMLISIFTYVNVNSHIIGGSRLTPHARHMHVHDRKWNNRKRSLQTAILHSIQWESLPSGGAG